MGVSSPAKRYLFLLVCAGICGAAGLTLSSAIPVVAQQPTGTVPTVTGTPVGALVKVALSENVPVYAGPIPDRYPIIGYLVPEQTVPALGRTSDSAWLKIVYYGVPDNTGWVYALYMTLVKGNLPPVVATPVPPTPYLTPTLSANLATVVAGAATPLSTFTPAPPLAIPTFSSPGEVSRAAPRGVIISLLLAIGFFGMFISLLRRS